MCPPATVSGPEVTISVVSSLYNAGGSSAALVKQPETPSTDAVITEDASKKQSVKEWIISAGLLGGYVALATGAGQFSNLAFTSATYQFKAPFLFVLFNAVFRTLAFPIYLTMNTLWKLVRGRKINFCRTWRRVLLVCGEDGLTIRVIIFKFFPPMFFNLLVQILYILGVQYLSASLASALGPPAIATSYLLSYFFLKTKLLIIKTVFVLVAFGGVIVIAYDQLKGDFKLNAVIGISSLLVADLSLSCYQILFKRNFPKGDLGQISFAVTFMYILMVLCYLPIPIILQQTGVETYNISHLPYPYLFGTWSCFSVSSLTYAYGLVVAGGFFMGLSDLLILGANTGIDALRGIPIRTSQIIGTVIIAAAFIVLVLPERYVSLAIRQRFDLWRWSLRKPAQSIESQTSPGDTRKYRPYTGLAAFSPFDIFSLNDDEDDLAERKDVHITDEDTQIKL